MAWLGCDNTWNVLEMPIDLMDSAVPHAHDPREYRVK
jgi:hypothetical protein